MRHIKSLFPHIIRPSIHSTVQNPEYDVFPEMPVDWNLSSDTDDCDDCDSSGGDDSLESYPPESTETRTEKATITLASERWRELLVPSGRKLCRGWAESLAAELQNVLDAPCTWTFRHASITQESKRKRGNYFRAYARCKRDGCDCTARLIIQDIPQVGEDVVIHVDRCGHPNHQGPPASRPLTGLRRQKAAERTMNIGAYNVRRDFLNSASEEVLREGDFSGVPSVEVLRKASCEEARKSRFSPDLHVDIGTTALASAACDSTSEKLKGAIHGHSYDPFYVHIYVEAMLRKYKKQPTALHIDATGSIVRNVNGRKVFCYAVVAAGTTEHSSYPLAIMLSKSHTTATITYFLMRLFEAFKQVFNAPVFPPAVVTDFSWPLLHATLACYAQTNVRAYLQKRWSDLNSE